MKVGLAITGGVASQEEINLAAVGESGFDAILVGCYEDEIRWEAETVASFLRQARRRGLDCYVMPWGYGRVLDPDPSISSLYIHTRPQTLQVDSRNRRCPKACPNNPQFLEWFASSMRTLAWLFEVQGFVWDEPSFHYSRGTWSCRCKYCQRLFTASYGQPMPRRLTPEVMEFRRQSLNMFVLAAAAAIQSVDRRLQSVVMPPPLVSPGLRYANTDDYRTMAASSAVDAVSLLIVEPQPIPVPQLAEHYASAAWAVTSEGKPLWLWVAQDQWDEEQLTHYLDLARELGAQRLVIADYAVVYRSLSATTLSRLLSTAEGGQD